MSHCTVVNCMTGTKYFYRPCILISPSPYGVLFSFYFQLDFCLRCIAHPQLKKQYIVERISQEQLENLFEFPKFPLHSHSVEGPNNWKCWWHRLTPLGWKYRLNWAQKCLHFVCTFQKPYWTFKMKKLCFRQDFAQSVTWTFQISSQFFGCHKCNFKRNGLKFCMQVGNCHT